MNKARRKAISALIPRLEALMLEVESLNSEIEGLADEEREYLENMPESFQSGDKGQAAEAAADQLDEAKSALEEIGGNIEAAIESLNTASE